MRLFRAVLDWFLPPRCKFCKDTGMLHHLNRAGGWEHRMCNHCPIYQGEI